MFAFAKNREDLVRARLHGVAPFIQSCRSRLLFCLAVSTGILLLTGCATAPLERAGTLSAYHNLKPQDDILTKRRVHSDTIALKGMRTVRLMPIVFSAKATRAGLTSAHQGLIANAASRALCNSLSRKFLIVGPEQPADLTVNGTITYVALTDGVASAASHVTSVAGSILIPLPVPVPRIPIGMGGLSVEAEARDSEGRQVAAVVWARGADAFTSNPRMSPGGDSYDLASNFSDDFSLLLKHGTTETSVATFFAGLPTFDDIAYAVDGKAKAAACAAYGDGPGLLGTIGSGLGAPPEWTDKGGRSRGDRE
jgi:Protein of unknown function (DUF3313)